MYTIVHVQTINNWYGIVDKVLPLQKGQRANSLCKIIKQDSKRIDWAKKKQQGSDEIKQGRK